MAYKALYRKYRPITFDDVVGQDTIVKTLKNAIENNKYSNVLAGTLAAIAAALETTVDKIFYPDCQNE